MFVQLKYNRDELLAENPSLAGAAPLELEEKPAGETSWVFPVFRDRLNEVKHEISHYDKTNEWDKMKKLSNPYELIHISNCKRYNNSLAAKIPVSRSYFKMKEILNQFKLLREETPIKTLSVAEGPGGFIEAIHDWRLRGGSDVHELDALVGYTLAPRDKFIPGWQKLKRKRLNGIFLKYGDLYQMKTLNEILFDVGVKEDHVGTCDLVTGDGGFDFSDDYTTQEMRSSHILYSELMVILNCVKPGGAGVIKVFDLFSLFSVQFIALMASCFDAVHLIKPNTSRRANSEKYLVGLGFRGCPWLAEGNRLMLEWQSRGLDMGVELRGLKIPRDLMLSIYDYNDRFVKTQIFFINKTFQLINKKLTKEEYERNIRKQAELAYLWCQDNGEPVNVESRYYSKLRLDRA